MDEWSNAAVFVELHNSLKNSISFVRGYAWNGVFDRPSFFSGCLLQPTHIRLLFANNNNLWWWIVELASQLNYLLLIWRKQWWHRGPGIVVTQPANQLTDCTMPSRFISCIRNSSMHRTHFKQKDKWGPNECHRRYEFLANLRHKIIGSSAVFPIVRENYNYLPSHRHHFACHKLFSNFRLCHRF